MDEIIKIDGLEFIRKKSDASCNGCFFKTQKTCPGACYCVINFYTYILIPLEL